MTEFKQNPIRGSEKILVIADDLTGAVDTGVQFRKGKRKTIVVTDNENICKSLKKCDVLVVDIESRFVDKESAYKKAFDTGKISKSENIRHFYKKLDSTMRGNVGAEISGIMDSLEIETTFIVPALPLYGRTTVNGNVYVNGTLLAETQYSKDPKNPVTESYIPSIISKQTDKKSCVVKLDVVRAGKAILLKDIAELIGNENRIIVVDAENDNDLEIIAAALIEIKARIMYAGCSGLAEKLAKYLSKRDKKRSSIVIAGSVNKITTCQAELASREPDIRTITIDTDKIITGKKNNEKKRILTIVKEIVSKGDDIIVRSTSLSQSVSNCLKKGKEFGMDEFKVSDLIADFLGELAGEIIRKNYIKGIVLTGGDTAIKTLNSLNIKGIVISDEILHGIPYGNFSNKKYSDLIVVTKAGGFGSEDAILQIINFLRNA
jgi:D-threonate/D-erythronate kinase